jgi:hypothetical protein
VEFYSNTFQQTIIHRHAYKKKHKNNKNKLRANDDTHIEPERRYWSIHLYCQLSSQFNRIQVPDAKSTEDLLHPN